MPIILALKMLRQEASAKIPWIAEQRGITNKRTQPPPNKKVTEREAKSGMVVAHLEDQGFKEASLIR